MSSRTVLKVEALFVLEISVLSLQSLVNYFILISVLQNRPNYWLLVIKGVDKSMYLLPANANVLSATFHFRANPFPPIMMLAWELH
jgi:hypothetical protein